MPRSPKEVRRFCGICRGLTYLLQFCRTVKAHDGRRRYSEANTERQRVPSDINMETLDEPAEALLCAERGIATTHTQFSEASTAKKLYCLWNAPVTKFWMYQVSATGVTHTSSDTYEQRYCIQRVFLQLNYWCFLAVLSVVTFLPGCGEYYLDLTVFSWTWLNLLEYMCRYPYSTVYIQLDEF